MLVPGVRATSEKAAYGSRPLAAQTVKPGPDGTYDEVEELLATDAAFIRRHRARSRLTRWLIIGVVAVALLALYVRTRSDTGLWDESTPATGGDSSGSDDGGSDDSTTTTATRVLVDLAVVDGALPIYGVATVEPSATARVRVEYGCADGSCATLNTPWATVAAGASEPVYFHRLRAWTNYSVRVLARDVGGAATTVASAQHIVTGSTGVAALDAQPFAAVTGQLGFDVWVTERSGDGFFGFVGLDTDGFVVWGLNMSQAQYSSRIGDLPAHVLAQYADHSFVLLVQGDTQLRRVDARGVALGEEWATPQPRACSALTHEAFLLSNATDGAVLTIQHQISEFEHALPDGTTQTASVLAQKLVRWDPSTGDMATMFDILDELDPATQTTWVDPFFPGSLSCTDDDGLYQTVVVEDFTHCNSASAGVDDNFIFSSRATSAVFSIADDGSGEVQWVVTPNDPVIPSDFAFSDEASKFYNQHFVRQLDSGNLLMIDNGNTRPSGHVADSYWSRAVEYTLDFDTGAIELVWEFAPPDTYTSEGGSIDVLANGNRLVHFPFIDLDGSTFVAHVHEVDAESAREVANMTVPWFANSSMSDTPTRGIALASIAGEAKVSGGR